MTGPRVVFNKKTGRYEAIRQDSSRGVRPLCNPDASGIIAEPGSRNVCRNEASSANSERIAVAGRSGEGASDSTVPTGRGRLNPEGDGRRMPRGANQRSGQTRIPNSSGVARKGEARKHGSGQDKKVQRSDCTNKYQYRRQKLMEMLSSKKRKG